MKTRPIVILSILFLLLMSFFVTWKARKSYAPRINLPDLAVTDLDGNAIRLDDFSGKPLIINFWATWCGPCREELPIFEKAKKAYGKEVNFLMVSDEPVDKLLNFQAANLYSFSYARLKKPFRELGITSVPFTYFYNSNGRLVSKKKDPISEATLNSIIAGMITRK